MCVFPTHVDGHIARGTYISQGFLDTRKKPIFLKAFSTEVDSCGIYSELKQKTFYRNGRQNTEFFSLTTTELAIKERINPRICKYFYTNGLSIQMRRILIF